MNEFDSTTFSGKSDDCDSICPYCDFHYQVEAEDCDENGYDKECSECGMKYHLRQVVSVTHYSTPDCELNGQECKFESSIFLNQHVICIVCSKVCGNYKFKLGKP